MKRCIEALVMIGMVTAIVAMAIAGLSGSAGAQPAQQFDARVATPRPGDVRLHITFRFYDTTGAVFALRKETVLRLPRGASLAKPFLDGRWFCDGQALRATLEAQPSGLPFAQRLGDLKPLIRALEHGGGKRRRAALANARACERARVGAGTGTVDARPGIPSLLDPIPFVISLFLSRGTVPGAIASLTAIGGADPHSPVVHKYPVLAGVHAIEVDNFVSEPTADGLYDLAFVIKQHPIAGVRVNIAEVHASLRSLRMRKGTCVARDRRGRCTRRLSAAASLFKLPACPPSGQFSAQLLTTFVPPTPSLTTTLQVPCPRFSS
jgi:hypothetical protein